YRSRAGRRLPARASSPGRTEWNFADRGCDLRGVGLEREVASLDESDDRVRDVALECLGSRRQKEWIVLAPDCEEGGVVGAEVPLKDRVERDVALVVAKEVELQLGHPGPGQEEIVERIAVR